MVFNPKQTLLFLCFLTLITKGHPQNATLFTLFTGTLFAQSFAQFQWKAVMGSNPSHFNGDSSLQRKLV